MLHYYCTMNNRLHSYIVALLKCALLLNKMLIYTPPGWNECTPLRLQRLEGETHCQLREIRTDVHSMEHAETMWAMRDCLRTSHECFTVQTWVLVNSPVKAAFGQGLYSVPAITCHPCMHAGYTYAGYTLKNSYSSPRNPTKVGKQVIVGSFWWVLFYQTVAIWAY